MGDVRNATPRGARTGFRLSTLWVSMALAFPVAMALATPMLSVDLAYLVRAGQVTLGPDGILRHDVFLFTARCDPWMNQQWGAELALASAFEALGWLGLALVRAGLAGGTAGLIYLACRASGAARRSAAWLTLLATVLLLANLHLRAQLFGLVLFAGVRWLVAGRAAHPRRLWLAVPLCLVWANVHGSFPLGPVLLLLAWLDDRAAPRSGRGTVTVGLLSLVATAVTPFGLGAWRYVVDLSTDPLIREVVQEWRPPWFTTYSGVAFFASTGLAVLVLWRHRRSLTWAAWIEVGAFFALAASTTRAVAWWIVILVVTFARLPWARREGAQDPRSRANTLVAGAIALLPIVAAARWLPYAGSDPPASLVSFAPLPLTSELRSVLDPGEPFFNPQSWGSWFELTVPNHPIFVDSRFEVMPDDTLRANGRISRAETGWEQELLALRMRVVVVDRATQGALLAALEPAPGWAEVYSDDEGAIFVREGMRAAEALPSCRTATSSLSPARPP